MYADGTANADDYTGTGTITYPTQPWENTYHGWPYYVWPQPYECPCRKSTKLTVEGEVDAIIDLIKNVKGRIKITIESV